MAPSGYDPSSLEEQPIPLPNAPIRHISERLSVQPPLSRRGNGPGVLVFLPGPSDEIAPSNGQKPLDPEPIQKWAEEGFAVAFLNNSRNHSAADLLTEAVNAFIDLGELLDTKDKFGIIVYEEAAIQSVYKAASSDPRFNCIIAYSESFTAVETTSNTALLLHTPESGQQSKFKSSFAKHYSYPVSSPSFVLPSSRDYEPGSAALAHSRSLVFLREHLGGPHFDLEAIWEEHTYFEFEDRSVAKTMATMVEQPYVNHIPTMTGGVGRENLTRFYRDHFIFSNPPDAKLQLVSRTVGPDRVVDEFVYHATHDRQVDWLLPGVPATGRKLSIAMLAVVNIRGDRLYNEHIWWDQASALKQANLLPSHVAYPTPEGNTNSKWLRLPVSGAESAEMLVDESKGTSNAMLGGGWGVVDVQD
ncbi:hypothetical protein MD484_g3950, partial [Candolleomyces efflorescens]